MKDKRLIRAIRRGYNLQPYSEADQVAFKAIKEGETVEITIKQRRSLPQLAAYWAMLARVVEATDAYPSAEHLHEALKMCMGYTTPIKTFQGTIYFVPDSVAFNKMTAPQFRDYFAKAEKLIAEQFGIDPAQLGQAA